MTKEFYDSWTTEEVDDYLKEFNILILFKVHLLYNEAEVLIHADIADDKKDLLRGKISMLFGGDTLSRDLCLRVNEYAERWYSRNILNKKAMVINFRQVLH